MAFGGIEPVSKAVAPVTRDMREIVTAMQGVLERNRREQQFGTQPYPRPEAWVQNQFGPGSPFAPEGLDPARTDTGQPDPRLWQYPVAWNIQFGKDRHVSWETLKQASEAPLFRACIELRKTEISTMDWSVRVSPKAAAKIANRSGQFQESVARELRDQYQDEIDRITDFWEVPDRKNGRNFNEWIALAMDEQLVWDALAIYPHMTYGGDLVGLWVLDGSTIMPLFDETGGRPMPPFPAYQQVMYGFPRGEFTAQVVEQDGQQIVPGGMLSSQLLYRRRVPRTYSPYGFSPTEQALLDGLLYNKRFQWMLAEYTEGSMPSQFMESDGMLDWTPTQVQDYERWLNDTMTGNTAERMRVRFLPPGLKPSTLAHPGERYRPDYDLHLVKLVAMHFGTTASELGFNDSGGLGSTGYHEGQEDINFRKGRLPDLRWFADLITEISRTHLKMPPELEFTFLGLDEEDEAAADAIDQNRVASGRMTLNQAVARIGLPALNFKEADMPMVQTARGVVFLEGSSEIATTGVMIYPASESNEIEGGISSSQGKTSPTQRRPIASAGGKPATQDVVDEITAFKRWSERSALHDRVFTFEHLTEDLAKDLAPDLFLVGNSRVQLAKASDAAPKVPGQDGLSILTYNAYGDQG